MRLLFSLSLAAVCALMCGVGGLTRSVRAAGVSATITFAYGVTLNAEGDHIATADWDGDGHLDLATMGNDGVIILWGRGDGTFETPLVYAVYDRGNIAWGDIAAGDVNNDGLLDLCVAAGWQNVFGIRFNQGGRQFGAAALYPFGNLGRGIAMNDFNEDGWLDAVISNHDGGGTSFMKNNGNGTFTESGRFPGGRAGDVRSADFDGDGHWDYGIVNYVSPSNLAPVYGDGTGQFVAGQDTGVNSHAAGLQVADFNNDSLPDMINTNTFDSSVFFHMNTGSGFQKSARFETQGYPHWMDVADFDVDGDVDVAVPTYEGDGQWNLLENRGSQGFVIHYFEDVGRTTRDVAAGDFNEDGKPDVALRQEGLITIQLNTTAVTVPPLPGLIGHWKGDGNANDAVAGRNGALVGAQFGGGILGQAFLFDGQNDAVSVPDNDAFRLDRAVSVAAWVNPTTVGTVRRAILVRGDDRQNLDPYSLLVNEDGKLEFSVSSLFTRDALLSSNALPTGKWSHVAATFDGKAGRMRLYVNGTLIAQKQTLARPLTHLLSTYNGGIGIGNHPTRPASAFNHPFAGKIDDVRLYGKALADAEVVVLADVTLPPPPAAPTNLAVAVISSSDLLLTWNDNSNNEDGFTIERRLGTGPFAQIAVVAPNVESYQNSGLLPDTTYVYRVRAFNDAGMSAYTLIESGRTQNEVIPAPSNLIATALSSTTIRLRWTDRSSDEAGFTLERATEGGPFAVVQTLDANIVTVDNSGLLPETGYNYRLRAFNATVFSGYSNVATARTGPPTLNAPTNLESSVFSSTKASLFWDDTSDGEEGYKLERSTDGVEFKQVKLLSTNVTEAEDIGLTAATQYWYRVRSYRGTVHSPYSNVETLTTLPPPPVAPAAVTVEVTSAAALKVRWQDKSSIEDRFLIERRSGIDPFDRVASIGANTTEWADTGLKSNTRYEYRVQAQNAGGFSAFSAAAGGLTLPKAPTGLVVTVPADPDGRTKLRIAWTDDNELPSKTKVERSDDSGVTFTLKFTVNASVVTHTDSGLTPDKRYVYRVRANNASGDSANSATADGATLPVPQPPIAPDSLTCTILSQTSAKLDWRDRSSDEDGFKVERATGAGAFGQVAALGAGIQAWTDTALSAATAYRYRVRSYRDALNSAYSAEVGGTTGVNPPLAPAGLAARVVGVEKIEVTWQDRSNNEERFVLERAIGDEGAFTESARPAANSTRFDDSDINPASVYRYRLRAENAGGASAVTAIVRAVVDRLTRGKLEVPRTLDFGKVKAKKSLTLDLVIRNGSPTERLRVQVAAPATPFTLTSGGGEAILEPGATRSVQITFKPKKKKKKYAGTLRITSSDPQNATVDVALTGKSK